MNALRFAIAYVCRRLRTAALRVWLSWKLATLEAQMHYLAEEAEWYRRSFALAPVEMAAYRLQLTAMRREREALLQRRAAL